MTGEAWPANFWTLAISGPCIEKPGHERPAEIVRGAIRNPGLPASNLKAHHQGLRGDGRTGGDNPGLRDRTEQRPGFIPPGGNPGIERVLAPIGSVNVPFPVSLPQDPQGPGFDVIVLDPGGAFRYRLKSTKFARRPTRYRRGFGAGAGR